MEAIAFINDHLGQGGVGTVNRRLMSALCDKGLLVYNVTIFENHQVGYARNIYLEISSFQAFLVIPLIIKLVRFFKTHELDYVVSSKDYINVLVILAFRLARVKNVTLLVNSHASITNKLAYEKKYIQTFSVSVARYLYRFADIVANVSEGASRDAEKYLRQTKVHTLYNPVVREEDISKRHPIPDHPFFQLNGKIIVACGRLEPVKNHELMLRALSIALRERPSLYLIILGDGSMRRHCKQLISNLGLKANVSLAGYVNDAAPYMAHCDLFWLTSKYEAFGVVLVEALTVGAKILSVNCPHGPGEILDNGRYGYLVNSSDTEINAKALLNSLDAPAYDPEMLKRRAMHFERDVCADRYLSVLRKYSRNRAF